jgi:hypothetical protein
MHSNDRHTGSFTGMCRPGFSAETARVYFGDMRFIDRTSYIILDTNMYSLCMIHICEIYCVSHDSRSTAQCIKYCALQVYRGRGNLTPRIVSLTGKVPCPLTGPRGCCLHAMGMSCELLTSLFICLISEIAQWILIIFRVYNLHCFQADLFLSADIMLPFLYKILGSSVITFLKKTSLYSNLEHNNSSLN